MQEVEYKKRMEEFAKKGRQIQQRLASQNLGKEERGALELEYEKVFSGFQSCLRDIMISEAIDKCESARRRKETDEYGYIG